MSTRKTKIILCNISLTRNKISLYKQINLSKLKYFTTYSGNCNIIADKTDVIIAKE